MHIIKLIMIQYSIFEPTVQILSHHKTHTHQKQSKVEDKMALTLAEGRLGIVKHCTDFMKVHPARH